MLDFSFEYRAGGFVVAPALTADRGTTALYGPSGAGKSLTLLCLAGLLRPTAGWIRLNGRALLDVAAGIQVPPHRRRLGVVFQEYALFPHLPVAGNLAYGLVGMGRAEVEERVHAMLRMLRLEGFGRRYPGELSGGQRQRVALGRGLIIQPELLLLDEPFSALDQMERERLRDEVMELLSGFGGTTLLVTHNLEEAYRMAATIAVIDGGRILQAGPRDELLRRPRDRRVAEHVGASNLFRGTVMRVGAAAHVSWQGVALTVAAGLPETGTTVDCCIRPENVRLVWPERIEGRANLLRGRLTSEVKRGIDYLLHFQADIGGGEISISCPEHLHSLMKVRPGMEGWISLPPDHLHVLEPVEDL